MGYGRFLWAVIGVFLTSAVAFAAEPAKGTPYVATIDPDGVQRVAVLGGGYYFDPNVIVVKANVPVELLVRKEGGIAPHDIVLKAPEAGIDFAQELSTEPRAIRFTPTKAGRYEFECTKKLPFFPSHKERGMHGVLVVE
jgi:plastocyanin domain-containing protein